MPKSEGKVRVLGMLSVGPQQHFEMTTLERKIAAKLWVEGLVTLAPGDVWLITKKGMASLDLFAKTRGADMEISAVSHPE